MDKRLAKRHKRQVARTKDSVRISEPDVRTPEQSQAARDASRPNIDRTGGTSVTGSATGSRTNRPPASGSAAKTAV